MHSSLMCLRTGVLVLVLVTLVSGHGVFAQQETATVKEPSAISPELVRELVSLRDAALTDDYAYRQLAHLADNIGRAL